MKNWRDLSKNEKEQAFLNAKTYYKNHKEHIDNLMKQDVDPYYSYPPSGSDMSHPMLWKTFHWRWFIFYVCR